MVYNGNNYGDEWVKEAAKRKLPNIRSTVAATKAMATAEANDPNPDEEVEEPEQRNGSVSRAGPLVPRPPRT